MKEYINFAVKWLSNPVFVNAGIVGVSVFSLASALTAQYVFGLAPCILCVYQRIPFVVATLLGLIGIAFAWQNRTASAWMVALSGVAFLVNSVIAFYHTGVELHWWVSVFEACSVTVDPGKPSGNFLESIRQAQAVPCDVIPWADPVFGLSMANYNAIMCLGLAIGCGLCAWLIKSKTPD